MARGYLNSASFPGESLVDSLRGLSNLRAGIAQLIQTKALKFPVMCSVRASQLALSPDYELLANGLQLEGGRYRDTIMFFLTVLDQQTPAEGALSEALKEEMNPHLVEEGLETTFDENAASVLVACALDNGILLSLGTSALWRQDRPSYQLMTNAAGLRRVEVDNVCDTKTADIVAERLRVAESRHLFENWDALTGGARCSTQVAEWIAECSGSPGLEQIIMRSLARVHANGYRPDGELVKKLGGSNDVAVFEVRAYFNGSNNVRILFGRDADGQARYGYGGLKAHPSWYDVAIPQATAFIKGDSS